MDFPPHLVEMLRGGRVVLFLGAGASLEAKNSQGKKCPSTSDLGKSLADTFLGGAYRTAHLSSVAQYAISEASQAEVEDHICAVMAELRPTKAHRLMPQFAWKGIVTTNYDTLVEQAYEQEQNAVQRLSCVTSDRDRMDSEDLGSQGVLLLKLHGCIRQPTRRECPLILTVDQYTAYEESRSNLFRKLEEWAYSTVVYVGHSLEDSDIREILSRVTKKAAHRSRHFIVAPDADPIKSRFWEGRNITTLKGTFADFMDAASKAVPKQYRSLLQHSLDLEHEISKKFAVAGAKCSGRLRDFLENHAEYVGSLENIPVVEPCDFYRGANPKWGAIAKGLDVPRRLHDAVLSDVFLNEPERPRIRLVVVKGPAGSGKSVFLQRLAWSAATEWGKLCLYLREEGQIDSAAIHELTEKCSETVFVFVDNGADHVKSIAALDRVLGSSSRQVCVVVGERVNEWNVNSLPVEHLIEEEYTLPNLSNPEIDALIDLLSANGALGTLKGKSRDDMRQAFQEYAGRQLLVALHEATFGRPFEDIVEDEFRAIEPPEARDLYLTVCVLNRFNAPIRAGAIARMHDLPFADFRQKFFRPLEHVVFVYEESGTKDHWYKARHPHIADIVFQRVLTSQEERYAKYIECLQGLNPGYSSDRSLIRSLIRARSLLDLFSNHELVRSVYSVAKGAMRDDGYVLQQHALYEMNRSNANLKEARKLLEAASEMSPRDPSIRHSMAELHVRVGDVSTDPRERNRAWKQAEDLLRALKREKHDAFPYATHIKIGLLKLDLILSGDTSAGGTVESTVKDIESNLSEGLQRFPGDPLLKEYEAKLAATLSDSARVTAALEAAYEKNPRSVFVARRLAAIREESGNLNAAVDVLAQALRANNNSQPLHYAYAKLLLRLGEDNREKALYSLARSYSPGDANREAQIRHGRELWVAGKEQEATKVFRVLGDSPSGAGGRSLRLFPIQERMSGIVRRAELNHAFVSTGRWQSGIYAPREDSDPRVWEELSSGKRVTMNLAFNSKGPVATRLQVIR